jgi:nitroimidazol reductase NimA-like FMN-containing flavoprotein (pyridoxamine 5'-phosphate oxidase superfamily)
MALTLDDVQKESLRYGPFAFVGSVSPSGTPYVSPVSVAWYDGRLLAFLATNEAKVANIRKNPKVTVHYSVSEATNWDSCILWGDAVIVDDEAGRTSLWDKMGYNLDAFEPGGPGASTHVFMVLEPRRALVLRQYGILGRESWHA